MPKSISCRFKLKNRLTLCCSALAVTVAVALISRHIHISTNTFDCSARKQKFIVLDHSLARLWQRGNGIKLEVYTISTRFEFWMKENPCLARPAHMYAYIWRMWFFSFYTRCGVTILRNISIWTNGSNTGAHLIALHAG